MVLFVGADGKGIVNVEGVESCGDGAGGFAAVCPNENGEERRPDGAVDEGGC